MVEFIFLVMLGIVGISVGTATFASGDMFWVDSAEASWVAIEIFSADYDVFWLACAELVH